jgi:hypothetical protein
MAENVTIVSSPVKCSSFKQKHPILWIWHDTHFSYKNSMQLSGMWNFLGTPCSVWNRR